MSYQHSAASLGSRYRRAGRDSSAEDRAGRRRGDRDRSKMQNSGRSPAEIRHRVVQHAEDHGAVFTREALLQRRKPAPHRFERWTNRLGGNDALDADGGGRLLAREQDFLQALAGPDPREGDVDVAPRLQTPEPNHPLGEIDELHRLAP